MVRQFGTLFRCIGHVTSSSSIVVNCVTVLLAVTHISYGFYYRLYIVYQELNLEFAQ